MIVDDFIKNKKETIPEGFYNILPVLCSEPDCNSPMVMTEILTGLQCSNPYCPNKITYRIYSLLKDIGVDYVTELQVHSFVVDHKIKNVFDIFLYDFNRDGLFGNTLEDIMSKSLTQTLRQNNIFTVEEYVRIAHIPYITLLIEKIFKNCQDLNDFYSDLEEQGILYLKQLLQDNEENISVELLKTYEVLLLYKEELLHGLDNVNLL